VKVQNLDRKAEEFKVSYFDSSIIPRDYTRHTYISKDNPLYFTEDMINNAKDPLRSRNMSYLQSNYASALIQNNPLKVALDSVDVNFEKAKRRMNSHKRRI
jgi:hypothetical protein